MCGNAPFSHFVHLLTPYLHLNPLATLAHEGRVQRLVAVGAGFVHPVAQAVGMGVVQLCERNVDIETFVVLVSAFVRLKYDTHCQDVENVLKSHMLLLHLVPDGVGCLYAAYYAVFESHCIQLFANGLGKLAVEDITFILCLLNLFLYA